MSHSSPVRDHYLAEYARLERRLPGASDAWLHAEREAALERFAETGFPSVREELWKYTDLRIVEKHPFEGCAEAPVMEARAIEPLLPAGLDAHRLVFVNGNFSAALSAIGQLPRGATLTTLASLLHKPGDEIRSRLNTTVNGRRTALTDMNAAFMSDGLYLDLDDGVALDRPVHVLFVGEGKGMANLRNLVRLGRDAEATVIEHYASAGQGDNPYLTNTVTEIVTGANARLTRCRVQQESTTAYHLGSLHVQQLRDSQVRLHNVDLGGRLARSDSNSRLEGTGAEIRLYGVYAPSGRQHIDNHTRIDHVQPHCTSREAYKGVLDGHGRGVFNGKIVVHKGAQKTDSEQSSAALLLSKTAEVDAKPELEIYNDDVKCAHGATVGQLDEEAVFYLQSRGVDAAGARNILTYSFADEVIREVGSEALRRHIEAHFLAKLPNGGQIRDLL